MKGKWKAIELDPSLFSEEGMEGLVCFEELTNYRMIDPEKAAAKAAKELKKQKKAKKRKASEGDVEKKDGEETPKPAKKKAKKKKNKLSVKESAQTNDMSAEAPQEDVVVGMETTEGEVSKESTTKDIKSIDSDPNTQSKPSKMSKKKKNQKQQREEDVVPERETNQESPSEPLGLKKEKIPKDKTTKSTKRQQKNWTNAALSGCNDKGGDVSAWNDLFVPSPVLKALSSLGFGSPTPIQALALPSAIRDHMDILGAAETGKMFLLTISCNSVLILC